MLYVDKSLRHVYLLDCVRKQLDLCLRLLVDDDNSLEHIRVSVTVHEREYLPLVVFVISDGISAHQLAGIDIITEYLRVFLNLLPVIARLVKIPRQRDDVVFDAPHIA
jgi:hypothetical protein